jgi:ATP-dependent RNA helicase DHX29
MATPRIQLSQDTEARVREALSSLPAQQAAAGPGRQKRSARQFHDVYASVVAEGFTDAAVQEALLALVAQAADVTVSSVFDWLCINASAALPPKFSAGERHGSKGGTVTVLAAARADTDSSRRAAETFVPPVHAGAPSARCAATYDADKERAKEWVRRYMDEQESESEEEALPVDVQPHSDAPVQEQLDAARFEAQLAALTGTLQDQQSLARELCTAREAAKRAKAHADAAAQQAAGSIIRTIKEQLQRLNISEEECLSALDDVASVTAAAEPGAATNAGEEDLGSMFDEGAAALEPRAPKAPALRTVLSHAARRPPVATAKRSKPVAQVDLQLPKSILQQHCAKQQWPTPRFERLPAGPGGFSYAVTLTCDLPGRRGKRQQHTSTIELPGERVLWSSVEEAQNAVAARALYQLLPDQAMHRAFVAPYDGLWRSWEEAAACSGTNEVLDREAMIAAFIDELLAQQDAAAPAAAARPRGAAELDSGASVSAGVASASAAALPLPCKARERSLAKLAAELREQLVAREQSPAYAAIAAQRSSLPIAAVRADVAAALLASDTLVICGDTGCGKTTQVPQFMLDDAVLRGEGSECSIIITQPRRVAVMSVADRVAFERLEAAPGAPGASVGYQVRLDAASSDATQLLFCTAGILLRRLHSDPLLDGISHVVVDEVHERSLHTDLLLTILRDLSVRRSAVGKPCIKLVLMSATLDSSFFSGYLAGCPVVSAQGRSFPVTQHHLEHVYEMCDYLLPLDSAAAIRAPKQGRRLPVAKGDRQRAKLVEDGWVRQVCSVERHMLVLIPVSVAGR